VAAKQRDDRANALAELARLVDGIPVAMVTTIAADDRLRCRPMLVERLEPDATFLFLTHQSSPKVEEVRRDRRVNVAFVSGRGDRYVSVSGQGEIAHDPERMRILWKPSYRAWFPQGPGDPDGAILTVHIEQIDYWDVPTSRMVRVWCAIKAVATGQVVEAGDHRTITLG
jgi:general stress protein 26